MRCSLKAVFILFLLTFWSVRSSPEEILPLADQPSVGSKVFREGETLVFKAKVMGIPAGWQTIEILSVNCENGREIARVRSVSETNNFFSKIYYFRDSKESTIDLETSSPLFYTKDTKERNFEGHVEIAFDAVEQKAIINDRGKVKEVDITPDAQDELSMMFLVRSRIIERGRKYYFPLVLRNETKKVIVELSHRERINTIMGKVMAIVLVSSSGHKLWLSDDERRIPLRIEAKTKQGKIVGTLEKIN